MPAPQGRPVLSVRGLQTRFPSGQGEIHAVDDVGFTVHAGETLALVGESGSGKSVTSLSIMRLIAPGRIAAGSMLYEDDAGRLDLARASEAQMRRVRGRRIGMIFQEPMTSLNPVFTVGEQIAETVMLHGGRTRSGAAAGNRRAAWAEAVEMLRLVGVPAPQERARNYPHQMSGGMRQRVMIAMALSCRPSLLIADEPTTALDVTIQSQIVALMRQLQAESGIAILFITHNLPLVSEIARRVAVLYAGQVVEEGDVGSVLSRPRHPYTRALLESLPGTGQIVLDGAGRRRLRTIPGQMFAPSERPPGCAFAPRCTAVRDACLEAVPPLLPVGDEGQRARCIRSEQL